MKEDDKTLFVLSALGEAKREVPSISSREVHTDESHVSTIRDED